MITLQTFQTDSGRQTRSKGQQNTGLANNVSVESSDVTPLLRRRQRLQLPQDKVQTPKTVTFLEQLPCSRHWARCIKCIV